MFFSRNGRDHPLPDPALIMRSAATRWNLHAPPALAVPEDLLRELGKLVYLADFGGRTVWAPVSATMTQTGFVGDMPLVGAPRTCPYPTLEGRRTTAAGPRSPQARPSPT